jgi:asparagine synthase (glutamine-hydrolysing)
MQDTLRGSALKRVPFFNGKAVLEMLDRAPALSDGAKAALDVPLMAVLTACVVGDRFQL